MLCSRSRGANFLQGHSGSELARAYDVLLQPVTVVDLHDMNLSWADMHMLLAAMERCDTLETLNISGCDLRVAEVEQVTKMVQRSGRLKFLALNSAISVHSEALASAIGQSRALQTLWMSMYAKDACIARALPQCTALTTLVLHFADDVCMTSLSRALPHCYVLSKLQLCGNVVGVRRARQLRTALGGCRNLTTLQLCGNIAGTDRMFVVLAHLHKCSWLETVDLTNNHLQAAHMRDVLDALTRCHGLRHLVLGENHLFTKGAAVLAEALIEWPYLQSLQLNRNRIDDAGLHILAAAVAECVGLRSIAVRGNGFGAPAVLALLKGLEVRLAVCSRIDLP